MRVSVLLVLLVVAGVSGGCNVSAALQDYCDRRGGCVCEHGDCCVPLNGSCDSDDVCCLAGERAVCRQGVCSVVNERPTLDIAPASLQFAALAVGASGEPTEVTVRNTGRLRTTPLRKAVFGRYSDQFRVSSGCDDEALDPGESCTFAVRLEPKTTFEAYEVDAAVEVVEFSERARLDLSGAGGFHVWVQVYGGGTVRLDDQPACGDWCDYRVATARDVTLAASPAPGHVFAGLTGPEAPSCVGDQCRFHVAAPVSFSANFEGQLRVHVSGSGQLKVTAQGTTTMCVIPDRTCTVAAFGAVTIAAASLDYQVRSFGGACAGTVGDTCTLDVTGPTDVEVQF